MFTKAFYFVKIRNKLKHYSSDIFFLRAGCAFGHLGELTKCGGKISQFEFSLKFPEKIINFSKV